MNHLEKALAIAVKGHMGQKDKAGRPYILHPLRVMSQMSTEETMIVAVLHDLVEDTEWTIEALRLEGFSEEIIEAVDTLTHQEQDSYEEYIQRIKANPLALKVKLADLKDNLDITRISKLTEKDLKRIEKYHQAWFNLA